MGATERQIEDRVNHLGGSDLASLFGLDSFQGVWDVWASKVYKLQRKFNDAMQAGIWLEGAILTYLTSQIGKIRRNQYRRVKGSPVAVLLDAIAQADGATVEAKASGATSVYAAEIKEWGEELTDEIPPRVLIQVQAGLMAQPDAPGCHVPAFVGGRGFCRFWVAPHTELQEMIREAADRFWTDYVETRKEPWDWADDVAPSLDVLKRIVRVPGKVLGPGEIDEKLRQRWESAKGFVRMAEEMRDQLKARLIAQLGDAEAAPLKDGRVLTYLPQERKGYTVEATSFPVLRIQKDLPQLESKPE